jgi:branched-subunit amino acid aminotransferase/4-amino-4-deoxychorismate lyase
VNEATYVFDGHSLHLVEAFDHPIQVADSFLVNEGRVRSLQKHKDRFNSSAEKLTNLDLDAFWDAAINLIPREGQVFPRLELSNDNLVLRLREPADFKATVSLWSADEPDDRIDPTTKGPDLSYGSILRRKANLYGADEAIILNQDGYVVEGALSSLLWWREDVLYGPDENTRWLPSVTRSDLFEIASQAGYAAATENVRPEDLIGLELWVVSSLTGIRPVIDWVNLGGAVGPQRHLESFQRRLKLMSSELS